MMSKTVQPPIVNGPSVTVQPPIVNGQTTVSDQPVSDQPTNQTEDDTKLIELNKLKSLEDNIILYIKKSGQHNKSIFLSMLINYVICYSGYPESIEELNKNNGIGFENHIKLYLIQLLNHYKNPKSSLKNEDISFSQIKLMLLSFFHTKISIIPDIVEPKIQHTQTGVQRQVSLYIQKQADIQKELNKEQAKKQKASGTQASGTQALIIQTQQTDAEEKAEFEVHKKGGFRDFSELSDALSDMFEQMSKSS